MSVLVEDSAARSFRESGYAVVDLLSEQQHAALETLIADRLCEIAASEPSIQPFDPRPLARYHERGIPDDIHRRMLSAPQRYLRLSEAWQQFFIHEKFLPVMDAAWGQHERVAIKHIDHKGEIVPGLGTFRIVRPGVGDAPPVHVDSGYGRYSMITVWMPIVGFDERFGLQIFPRSHKHKHPSDALTRSDKFSALPFSDSYVGQFQPLRPQIAKGQAIIFNDNLLHGAAENVGDNTRVSMEIRFFQTD